MNILIVEDEPKMGDFLRKGLIEHDCTVDLARDGVNGLALAVAHDYDAVVLDVMLPGLDGFGVLEGLRVHRQTPVLMLTARDAVEDRVRGLQTGADDYLIKPFSFLELLTRLHVLRRRGKPLEESALQIADLQIDLIERKVTRDGRRIELSAKEFLLLLTLARHRGRILSKTELAELVWDMNFDSQTNIVEVAVMRLRAKIDGPFPSKLLRTVRGMGYVLDAPAAPRPA